MDRIRGLFARFRALRNLQGADLALDEEMRFHLDLETEKNVTLGMSPAEARRQAIVAFGGMQRTRDAHRDVRGARWTEEVAADTRYALRALRRSPGIAVAAIATLALGIGASTAIFSAVNAVILRPLPFPKADRLVEVTEDNPERAWVLNYAAAANYLSWRTRVSAFQDAAAYSDIRSQVTWSGDGDARLLNLGRVTGNFFSTLGVAPAHGRDFTFDDTWYQGPGIHVGILSDRAWRTYFNRDTAAIGRSILLNGRTVQIVGVMPPGFGFPWNDLDVYLPYEWNRGGMDSVQYRRAHTVRVIARIKPSVSVERANAELRQVAKLLETEFPQTNRLMGASVTPLHTYLIGNTRRPLMLLLGAVGFLLVLACANIANLLLVHANSRRRETAMRLALGAGRYRLVRQAITESLVLSAAGGVAGFALGLAGTRALVALRPAGMLEVGDLGVDWRVLAFVTAVTTVCGVLFGTAPALWNWSRNPGDVLKEGGRTATSSLGSRRWDNGLVVVEIAIAVVLTCGAGLLTRSFVELRSTDPGFDPRHVLTVRVTAAGLNYRDANSVIAFYNDFLRRARGIPGVQRAAGTTLTPLSGVGWTSDYYAEGKAVDQFGKEAAHRVVTPDYFRTMGVRVVRGREFIDSDVPVMVQGRPTNMVTIINETLARSYFPNENPIGRRVVFDRTADSASNWRTIVGVVADERQASFATPSQIEFFEPVNQRGARGGLTLLFRTSGEPTSVAAAVQRLVREMDASLAIETIEPMTTVAARSLAKERFMLVLLGVFATVGLFLSVIGVYGVVSQLARRRRHELGVRIALGARGAQVQWLIVRHGAGVAAVGLLIGGAMALWATRSLTDLLYHVTPGDPLTYGVVALSLGGAAIMASWVPARLASRVDPIKVLREE